MCVFGDTEIPWLYKSSEDDAFGRADVITFASH